MGINKLSPSVDAQEYDLTNIIPSVSTSAGAIAGIFGWGPVGSPTLINSETNLKNSFGPPTNLNAETWFTAANFLAYSSTEYVCRAANTTGTTPFGTFFAANASSNTPSNIFNIASGNTNAFVNGMFVAQTTNNALVNSGNNIVISVVNSSAISISGANVSSNSSVSLYFGNPGTTYTAVALATNTAIVSNLVNQIVSNPDSYYSYNTQNFDNNVIWAAKYPGGLGNSLRISVCDSPSSFNSSVNLSGFANSTAVGNTANSVSGGAAFSSLFSASIGANTATITVIPSANGTTLQTNNAANYISNQFSLGDNILVGNSSISYQYLHITSISPSVSNSTVSTVTIGFDVPYRLHTPFTSNTVINRYWEFCSVVGIAPAQSDYVRLNGNTAAMDQMHVVVVDDNGMFSGVPGTVLETYKNLSRAIDAKNSDASDNYYADVINQGSEYVWFANDRPGAGSANSSLISSSTNSQPGDFFFTLGTDGYSEYTAPLSVLGTGYSYYANKEDITIDLLMQGYPAGGSGQTYQLANYIIDNILATRLDCIGFISPDKSLVLNNYGNQAQAIVGWSNNLHDSSYAFVDSGYKYQYDTYNNVYRFIPLNGDIAGIAARCDQTNNPWWSFAGFNRGQIKNLVKLAYSPSKTDRDLLYPNGINPVVTFKGQGTVLYGDKTFLSAPSAFDRINVRRLFIVLERAISKSAQFSMFEFNDSFTQANFCNMVNPYLRTIQGLRGITAFDVVCDSTNNTPAIVDADQFVGSIFIQPARSINNITLNFVAVSTGVQFATVVGSI